MAKHSRHYRAAQKEVEAKPIPANGFFVRNSLKNKIIGATVGISILVFLNGIIMGYFIGKSE